MPDATLDAGGITLSPALLQRVAEEWRAGNRVTEIVVEVGLVRVALPVRAVRWRGEEWEMDLGEPEPAGGAEGEPR
jgi:hypothetical protein